MQVIYGPNAASNILLTAQKRLVRPVYAQTQGFPYAAVLDPYLRTSAGTFRAPVNGDTAGSTPTGGAAAAPLTYGATTFTYQGSVVPGTVLVKSSGGTNSNGVPESVVPHPGSGTTANPQPFGLLGQWLGGTFDNVGTSNQVGVWQGPDSVYDLVAPAFDYTNINSTINSTAAGTQVLLYVGNQASNAGLLTTAAGVSGGITAGTTPPVARVIALLSSAVLRVQLLV